MFYIVEGIFVEFFRGDCICDMVISFGWFNVRVGFKLIFVVLCEGFFFGIEFFNVFYMVFID